MRLIVLALSLSAVSMTSPPARAESSATEVYARFPAPIGHRQPTVRAVERARAARGIPANDPNEPFRQIEHKLRNGLSICRGC